MLPLEDIRIIAVEQYGAGPFGSLQLAHLGADVIKVEDTSTGGDISRYVPPYAEGEDSLFFETFNRDKRSICLDLRNPSGRAVFEDLVRQADAVYSNLRGDVPAKLRILYDDLKHINPKIVCCSLSGFGMTGPRASEPGYDYVLQGYAGWMSLTGDPEGPPEKTGISLVDYSGGFVAALSLLAGVHAARRDGIGMDCDVSLYDTAIGLLTYLGTWHMTEGYTPQRLPRSAHPSLVPFQAFPAQDGWLVIACPKEKFWHRLVDVLNQTSLKDPRFATFTGRAAHRTELEAIMDSVLATRSVEDWILALREAGVPCAPVNDIAAALTDERTIARDMLITTDHPRFGTVKQVSSPVRVGPVPRTHRRAPQLGEHNSEVLRTLLDYDDADLARLTRDGAFGSRPNP
ncbi:CoA transferase [Rhodococcus sp. NPDC049939]|uniref:CaiB/BaiF CoA transferase family protein n=1 Tax=Rhodococcus sp. NPDC049939 TaxID=3155511 RepID=UPI0033FF4A6F